jgi:hypothetical protein
MRTSVTTLDLSWLKFEEAINPAEAALNLSASIAENTSLEVLHCGGVDSFYLAAMFRGLAKQTKIKALTLKYCGHFIPQELEALRLALTAKT